MHTKKRKIKNRAYTEITYLTYLLSVMIIVPLLISVLICFSIVILSSSINQLTLKWVYAEADDGEDEGYPSQITGPSLGIVASPIAAVADSSSYYYYPITLLDQLGNFMKKFEYTVDLEGKQIFPNDKIKQDIISKYKPAEYNITNLNYELLGFRIIASNIKIHVDPTKIDYAKTRVNIPLMHAKNVKVSNGPINLSYNEIDLGSIYGIYDKNTDKMTVHIPISIALKYIR